MNEIFKGPATATVRIQYYGGDGSSCGYRFPLGESRLIAAFGDMDRGFETGLCTQYPLDRGGEDNSHLLAAIRYRDKLSVFDRALARSPNDAVLLLRKVAFLTRNRDVDRGLQTVEQLLALTPDHRDALLLKAELLTAKGRDDDARKIISTLPDAAGSVADEMTRQWIWMLVRQGRLREIPEDWRDFEGIEMDGGRIFRGREVEGANFRGARLNGVILGSNLRGADFTGAVLSDVALDEADLSNASLRNAQLGNAKWQRVDLSGADLEGVRGSIQIIDSKLDRLWAPWAELPGSVFHHSIRGAVFAGSNLAGSWFTGVDLSGVDFTDANLSRANLDHSDLTGAILRKANLRGASLNEAKLGGTDLLDAVYDHATAWPDGFDPAGAGARKAAD